MQENSGFVEKLSDYPANQAENKQIGTNYQ